MKLLASLRSLLATLRDRARLERDMEDELRAHLQSRADDLVRSGLPRAEAERRARIEFGSREKFKEECREALGTRVLDALLQDLRFAFRMLRKSPAFTFVAILTLALGIGANTVIFSLVSTVLLRPLPIVSPEQVFAIHQGRQSDPSYSQSISYPNYKDMRDRNTVLSGLALYRFDPISLSHNGANERVWGYLVTGNYFSVLGVKPFLGRLLTPDDDRTPSAHPLVVLSYGSWRRRFGADPAIVGSSILINGHSFVVIGVAPPNFSGTESIFLPEFWIPSMMQEWIETSSGLQYRGDGQWLPFGRLKPGVTQLQAQAQLNSVARQLAREYPDSDAGMAVALNPPGLVEPGIRNAVIAFTGALMLTVFFVLLIACINLAGLQLVRATQRRREIAIRMAIGATRISIARQLLTESVVLSVIGAAAGLALGLSLIRVARASLPATDFALSLDLRMDWRVLAFVASLALLTGIGFGLAPALHASRSDVVSTLKEDDVASRRAWLRSALVVFQVALSFVLLITAGLTLRSLTHTQALGPGFDPDNAVTMSMDLGLQGYDTARGENFYRLLVERVRALPGVSAVGLIRTLPLSLDMNTTSVYPDGRPQPPFAEMPVSIYESITPGYFAAMRIPLLAGRDFTSADTEKSRGVLIINETLAQRFWPGENPIGKRLHTGNTDPNSLEVVGLARNGKYQSLGEIPGLLIYYPYTQQYASSAALVVRTAAGADAGAEISLVRDAVQKLDPTLPLYDAKTLREHLRLPLYPLHAGAVAIGSFALLAVILAAIGIYGVMAYSVGQRTHEIGIRMALGARPSDVWAMILRLGLVITAIGMAVGFLCALGVSGIVSSLLYGVSPTDPLTFIGISLLLGAVALVSCFIPARRATRVDPVIAIRTL